MSHALVEKYKTTPWVQNILQGLQHHNFIHCSGLSGSLDTVLFATLANLREGVYVCVVQDKEEALFYQHDLLSLGIKTYLFPSSYRKPYQIEEQQVENANVLQRAEVLHQLTLSTPLVVLTYPDALSEKVISAQSLEKNKVVIKKGDVLDIYFLQEVLQEYEFDRTDLVYEAGQFAVRGGIIDVFSYTDNVPYRIELWGETVHSLRTFNPEDQLSIQEIEQVTLLPNVQTRLRQEKRISFFSFLPPQTTIFIKDVDYTQQVLNKYYDTAVQNYFEAQSKNVLGVSYSPEEGFMDGKDFLQELQPFKTIEIGTKQFYPHSYIVNLESTGQPSFLKNFKTFATHIQQYNQAKFKTFVVADTEKQLNRIQDIFEDTDTIVDYTALQGGLRGGFIDLSHKIVVYTDHQIFEKYHRYKENKSFNNNQALTLKEFKELKPGDFVVHIDHGIGKFAGLETLELAGKKQEAMKIFYEGGDVLYVSIHALSKVAKYSGKEGNVPRLHKLGSTNWKKTKEKTKKRVKELAFDLLTLYAKRKLQQGFACTPDNYLNYELEASFMYEDTPDQITAWEQIKADMESAQPMDRLLCGDVGCGKTEMAMRAAFKAVVNGKQVAILVPTTILASQHYHTFSERLKSFGVTIRCLNRFRPAKEMKETLQMMETGKAEIVIGTHRLVSKDIKFKELGLLIIDEEQKFGVGVKEKLRLFKENVDTLTLTATPIPRTLYFSLIGARDLSTIKTMPPNRQPVQTEVLTFSEETIRDAVAFEVARGGQVYFVHNRIEDIFSIAGLIQQLVPDARVIVGHGQMGGDKLEEVMMKFIEGEADVLVSTTIIEAGLDIENANTILIHNAHHFGLSDLHQMRGRVGRSNKKAFCYLLAPPLASLSSDLRRRLQTLEEFSDLGAGFSIALRDLEIRGSGDLLGADQSGFITEIGFETYQQILKEAVQELKKESFSHIFETEPETTLAQDCSLELEEEIRIPDTYVSNIAQRMNLYTELAQIENEEKLTVFIQQLEDRFGKMPTLLLNLLESIRLKWLGKSVGFERIVLKNNTFKGYFIADKNAPFFKSEVFQQLLMYVAKQGKGYHLKQVKDTLSLTIENMNSLNKLLAELQKMQQHLQLAISQN